MADSSQALSLLEYTEDEVHQLFCSLGLDQYEHQIHEHGITGDVLQALDAEGLREIGINSVGQRLAILKAVYILKVQDGITIEPEHYVPPSEIATTMSLTQLHSQIQQLEQRIMALEEENYRLQDTVQLCVDDMMANAVRKDSIKPEPSPSVPTLKKQPSLKWAPYKGSRSPTKAEHESPSGSPLAPEHHIPPVRNVQTPDKAVPRRDTPPITATPSIPISNSSAVAPQQSSRGGSSSRSNGITDAGPDIRSFKVSLEDPAWKVLPAALKKYKINNDDWQNYAMFICYGNTERCLSYDEKPLLLFQKLKEAKKNPVFMLKHIRDIRSPIAVAQQKQAARREKEQNAQRLAALPPNATSNSSKPSVSRNGSGSGPALTVNGGAPPLTTASLNSPWPDVMSPVATHNDHSAQSDTVRSTSTLTLINSPQTDVNSHGPSHPLMTQSYAVAIYPYTAEQEDEFDVQVNDTFVINSRARGWWIVQRDPTGSGRPETDGPTGSARQGWVPAGCLLETNLPVSHAIQEAVSRGISEGYRNLDADRTPIMPTSIVSTSYPGIALMDYRRKGEEELDLVKDDMLRVFKRYNHWSYAVKENNGDRGWVPSWFIGKIGSSAAGVPPTPAPHTTTSGMSGRDGSATLTESDLRYALDGPAASPISPGFMGTQQSSGRI